MMVLDAARSRTQQETRRYVVSGEDECLLDRDKHRVHQKGGHVKAAEKNGQVHRHKVAEEVGERVVVVSC